jgi:NRPS condensation-like uncharacterized protein
MNPSIPASFPTTILDRYISAVFAPKCDVMLQVELIFDQRLDRDILRKALDLALDAEPVLGCRFSVADGRAVWKRVPAGERSNFEQFSREEDYNRYKRETLDAGVGPALRGAVFFGQAGDRLLLKVAHEAADAGGAKDVAYLVASLYRKLKNDPSYLPAPNLSGSRDLDQVMKHVPTTALPRIWFNALRELFSLLMPRESYSPFSAPVSDLSREYVMRVIPPERTAAVREFCNERNAKINDVLLAAFLLALSRTGWNGKSSLRCAMSVDLRKWYLPVGTAEAIANLSGLEFLNIGVDPGENLSDTLGKVVAFTAARKRSWIGLSAHASFGKLLARIKYDTLHALFMRLQRADIKARAVFPIVTNLGPLDHARLDFESSPLDARIMVPAAYPPFFGIGISGYRDSLTVSAAAFPETRRQVNEILDSMLDELPGSFG